MILTRNAIYRWLCAGIAINIVMLGVNINKGGWWWLFVPLHLLAMGACIWSWWRLRQYPADLFPK